jgi:hypothetical protein
MQQALNLGRSGVALAKIAIANPDLPLHAENKIINHYKHHTTGKN